MRAAIVYDCLFPLTTGGGERVYRRIAELLVERGVAVDYVTRRQWEGEPPAAPFAVVGVWDGELYDAGGVRRTAAALGFARAVRGWLRPRRGDYDLVIASALPVLTLLAARLALGRRPFLVGDWLEVWPAAKWRAYAGVLSGTAAAALQWLGARAAALHTVNSRFSEARLLRVNRRARTRVLGLVDLIEAPAAAVRAAAEPPFALFVGRHIADKRVDAIPAAIALIRSRGSDLRAVVAGDGPERGRVAAEIARVGLADAVELPGFVEPARLEGLLSSASVLVNPSAREGFGLVVAEAASHGLPSVVVAGPENAAATLIEEGVNGFVAVDAGPEALAAAIESALAGGDGLRASTRAWYDAAALQSRLSDSVDGLLDEVRRRAAS